MTASAAALAGGPFAASSPAALAVPAAPAAQGARANGAGPSPFDRRTPVVQTVERVGPAVVNISTEQRVQSPFGASPWDGGDSPWDQMFRNFFEGTGAPREQIQNSLGSGVIVDPDGFILTNFHVVSGASRIRVTLSDKRQFDAEAVGADEDSDLAVLKVDGAGQLPSVAIHDADDLMIGETVIAIGNPFGLSNTVSVGVVSGRERTLPGGERRYNDFIQTDAAINPGNSGGALLDINGQLIGINTAIIGGATGIGFAIPATRARTIYRELIDYREVRPAWLGFEAKPLDAETAGKLGFGTQTGLLVTSVSGKGPAAEAGVEPGDLLLEADGRPLVEPADLDTALGRVTVGQPLTLDLTRDGAPRRVSLKVAPFPGAAYGWERLGVHVLDISPAQRQKIPGLPEEGVIVTDVRPGSPASQRGIQAGDALVQLGASRIRDAAEFLKLMPRLKAIQSVYLGVVRSGRLYRVSVRLIENT